MTRQTSVQLIEITERQVQGLVQAGFENFTNIVRIAIDRLHRETILVTIVDVETNPQLDPYHRDTGGETTTQLWIKPTQRTAGISQEMDQGGIDADVWHNRIVTAGFEIRPDEEDTDQYLHSAQGQALLARVCDGHTTEWDGNNMIGALDENAEQALGEIITAIEDLPKCGWTLWSADDWLSDVLDEYVNIDSNDDEIAQTAAELEKTATVEHIIIIGNIADYLTTERNLLREMA